MDSHIDRRVGPDVALLLLARAQDFFDVVKVLLERRSIRERLRGIDGRGIRIGAEQGELAMFFFDQQVAYHAADGAVRDQKGLVLLGHEPDAIVELNLLFNTSVQSLSDYIDAIDVTLAAHAERIST